MATAAATVTPSPTAALPLANVVYEKKGAFAYVTVNRVPGELAGLRLPLARHRPAASVSAGF
jgi:hypothetical protein